MGPHLFYLLDRNADPDAGQHKINPKTNLILPYLLSNAFMLRIRIRKDPD